VRQFAFSFIGELAKRCPNLLLGKIAIFLPLIMKNLYILPSDLDPNLCYLAICNNASWAIGEIAIAYAIEVKPFVGEVSQKLVELLQTPKLNKTLAQNLSIALGRLGLVSAEGVSPYLSKMLKPFCLAMEGTRSDLEKHQAFRGLFLVISANPNAIVEDFPFLCHALVGFVNPDPDLKELAMKLIQNFKLIAGNLWMDYFNKFPKSLQVEMSQKFNV